MRVLELLASNRWTGPAEPVASVARELVRRGHAVEIAVETARGGTIVPKLRELGLVEVGRTGIVGMMRGAAGA